MGKAIKAALVAASVIAIGGANPIAHAQSVVVISGAQATQCSKDASFAADTGYVAPDSIPGCTMAIQAEPLSNDELAGTYVNRGILSLVSNSPAKALKDFTVAVTMQPAMANGYVNRGAALIVQKKYRLGIVEIDRGLALGPSQPEKAYFNRALAHEYLDDMKDAYLDYTKALELKPGWDKPQNELLRFTLERPAGGGAGLTQAVR